MLGIHQRFKALAVLLSAVVVNCAALVGILAYFDIKPKDLTVTLPHWGWLASAFILYAVGITSSIRAYIAARRQPGLEALHMLRCQAIELLRDYKHLDHDYRDSVKFPLNTDAFPSSLEPWGYVQVRLAILADHLNYVGEFSMALCEAHKWEQQYVDLFHLKQDTTMVDLISALEEFKSWKPATKRDILA
jgi:hypothetical protein